MKVKIPKYYFCIVHCISKWDNWIIYLGLHFYIEIKIVFIHKIVVSLAVTRFISYIGQQTLGWINSYKQPHVLLCFLPIFSNFSDIYVGYTPLFWNFSDLFECHHLFQVHQLLQSWLLKYNKYLSFPYFHNPILVIQILFTANFCLKRKKNPF